MVEFTEYPAVIVRNLNHCVKGRTATSRFRDDHRRRRATGLCAEHGVQVCRAPVLELPASPRKPCGNSCVPVQRRKGKLAAMQARLADINALVKSKTEFVAEEDRNMTRRTRKGSGVGDRCPTGNVRVNVLWMMPL